MVQRLWDVCERAEGEATDESRLAAYDQLRQMLSWLRLPLVDPDEPTATRLTRERYRAFVLVVLCIMIGFPRS